MTIREKSELNIFKYTFKLVVPRGIKIFAESAKEAWPFFYNIPFVILIPILAPIMACIERNDMRKIVKREDERKAKNDKNKTV